MSKQTISSLLSLSIVFFGYNFYKEGNFELLYTFNSLLQVILIASLVLLFYKKARKIAIGYIIIFLIYTLLAIGYSHYSGLPLFNYTYPQDKTDQNARFIIDTLEDIKNTKDLEKETDSPTPTDQENIISQSESEKETSTTLKKPENFYLYESLNKETNSLDIIYSRYDSEEKKTFLNLYPETEDVSLFSWNDDFSRVAFVVLNLIGGRPDYPHDSKIFVLKIDSKGTLLKKDEYDIPIFYECNDTCWVKPVRWKDAENLIYKNPFGTEEILSIKSFSDTN